MVKIVSNFSFVHIQVTSHIDFFLVVFLYQTVQWYKHRNGVPTGLYNNYYDDIVYYVCEFVCVYTHDKQSLILTLILLSLNTNSR
jgi:hypothetical protein